MSLFHNWVSMTLTSVWMCFRSKLRFDDKRWWVGSVLSVFSFFHSIVDYIVACVTFFFFTRLSRMYTEEKMVACKWVYIEEIDKQGNIDNNIILQQQIHELPCRNLPQQKASVKLYSCRLCDVDIRTMWLKHRHKFVFNFVIKSSSRQQNSRST